MVAQMNQSATPKLPKKVLHIGDIVAHWEHWPGKIEMKFLIKNRLFLPILKIIRLFFIKILYKFNFKQEIIKIIKY